jgi:hypothetical protein
VDLVNRTALLLKTKTGANSTRFLTDQLISRLYDLKKGKQPGDRVFRYGNRHAVNERIVAVCASADISCKPSHTCGRHAFANIALSMGIDIKSTIHSGGWKSTAVVLGTYANPRNVGLVVAERFNLYQYTAPLECILSSTGRRHPARSSVSYAQNWGCPRRISRAYLMFLIKASRAGNKGKAKPMARPYLDGA